MGLRGLPSTAIVSAGHQRVTDDAEEFGALVGRLCPDGKVAGSRQAKRFPVLPC
jgi:hypothetical protein